MNDQTDRDLLHLGVAALPLVLLAALGSRFFADCTGGWCQGARQGFVVAWAALATATVGGYALLRRRGMHGARAAALVWVGAASPGALAFAFGQFYEGDPVMGAVGILAALMAGTAAFRLMEEEKPGAPG